MKPSFISIDIRGLFVAWETNWYDVLAQNRYSTPSAQNYIHAY